MSEYSAQSKEWMYNKNLKGLLNEIANRSEAGFLLSNPNLAIGTNSAAKVKHDAFTVVKDGVFTTIAGGEVAFTATTHDIADGYEAIFLVYLDGTTVKLLKGTAVEIADPSVAVCPDTPAGMLKLGEVKVSTDGALFDAGTTFLSATEVTDVYTSKTDIISGLA